ncbi:MAG: cellulase family glycosylhydrolase [Paludibacteraceae bacterium]|nr:cellulase family glycosylhydrolase [Paludibacteraceae bacterium]
MVLKSTFKKMMAVCGFVACSLSMSAADYPVGSPVYLNGKLSVQGTKMVNECGNPVQLRGMSSHGLAWFPSCYREDGIKTLVNDWGIDIFRLAIYTHEWGGYTTEQWKSMDDYNEYIDQLVEVCGKYGIYCMIDWHVLNQGSGNPNTTLDDAIPFWDYMSKKHKDDKHVLYEICNEPNGTSVTWDKVKEYADQVIPVIRANDPSTIVICGTPTWSQDVDKAAENPLSYDNVMYTLHFYSGTHTQYLRDKGDVALSKGLALFVTEFGTSRADGNGGVFLDECDVWMDWMKERKISWCNWSIAGKKETSNALNGGACDSGDWNNTSASGTYIKAKLLEPDEFQPCGNSVDMVSYNDQVFLTPNPVKDAFSLLLPDGAVVTEVEVSDMAGVCVARVTDAQASIDASNLIRGIYFVTIKFTDGVAVKKFIKE